MKFSAVLIVLMGRELLVVHMRFTRAIWRESETLKIVVLACAESEPLTAVVPHWLIKPLILTRLSESGRLECQEPLPNRAKNPKMEGVLALAKLKEELKLANAMTANNSNTTITFFIFITLLS